MDYYTTLDVSKTASLDDIKKAYRRMAMKYHPDRNGGDDTQFKKIQEAYDVLSDPQKRQMYDNPRPQFSFNHDNMDMNDLFSQFFGQRRNQKQTFRTQVTVSLVDAYKGSTHTLQINTPTGNKVINIEVTPGIRTGDSIRYDNVIENAVLLVQFVVLPDLRFDRKGDDLYANHSISVLELIVGGKFKFTTIDQRTLEVKVVPKTQPYTQLRIPKAGMPNRNGDYGDQIILLKPFVPDNISQQVVDAINNQINASTK